ncbi:MAG: efflux RND transporter periplasmic adaptor subunit [Acidaminococcaceae bacterium]|nr:efflux RND transporter periplasmic adaptor subunit [Acidaminococcaceae bacterium]MBQ9697920.1 efflux RND transporter periplasmic adaptor subunit [Acidaminococcaceae bacterium]
MIRNFHGKWGKRVAVALAISGVLAFAGCGNKQAQQKAPAAVAVKTMQVIKRDTPNIHEFTGFVEAQQAANLTANVSGKITSKNFNGGDWVEAGQVLFTIDQRTYRANVLNAQAGLAAARTEYNRLNADAERYAKLYEQNAVSRQQFDLAIAQRESAKAQVAAQEAILENAQINMGDTEVKAPFSGKISTSDLSVGNFVAAGQTVLATMSNTNPVRIKFSMSENEYIQLSKAHSDNGAKALEDLKLVLSDGSIYTGAGVVDQVDREIGSGTGALTLKARFSNDDNMLMPGMFARLQANEGTVKNAMLIPQRAVKEMLYKKFVFVVGSDNKVDMKEVTLGARVGKLWLVESGLNGDETLVVEGVQKVNKGSEVKPAAMTEADLSNESKQ